MRYTVHGLRERPLLILAHKAVLDEGTVRPLGTCKRIALSMLALLLPRSPALAWRAGHTVSGGQRAKQQLSSDAADNRFDARLAVRRQRQGFSVCPC